MEAFMDRPRSMETAPRDGTPILIFFGCDGCSSAMYSQNLDDPYPWKFLDEKAPGVPMLNGARDDVYGPTGWMPMPKWQKPEKFRPTTVAQCS
jgi:hypothetical protein